MGSVMGMTLKERYHKEIRPKLMQDLGLANPMAVPRVRHIVINVGMGSSQSDPKIAEVVERSLTRISGQRPVRTLARKSIASFKIRQGMPIGMMVTMRGPRMWDFLEKLVRVSLPRIRDFRGIGPTAVDDRGNLSIGFREHLVFPEIKIDEVDKIHGLQVTIASTAGDRARGAALFSALGFPFREK